MTLPANERRQWLLAGQAAVSATATFHMPEATPKFCFLGAGGKRQVSCQGFKAGQVVAVGGNPLLGHHRRGPDWGT